MQSIQKNAHQGRSVWYNTDVAYVVYGCTVYVRVGGLISPRKWGEAMDISTTIDLISLVLFAVGLGITIGKIKK